MLWAHSLVQPEPQLHSRSDSPDWIWGPGWGSKGSRMQLTSVRPPRLKGLQQSQTLMLAGGGLSNMQVIGRWREP